MDRDQEPKVTRLPAGRARGLGRAIVSKGSSVSIEVDVAPRSAGPAARPWEPAGSIDVEQLVIWAFRDQRADRQAHVGMHRIEIEAAGGISSVYYGRSSDGSAAIADIQHLGCRIDRRVGIVSDAVHPAASAVEALSHAIDDGDLVRFHGALGGRPDGWKEPERWYRPVVWVKHGEEAQWERTGRGTSPTFCRVIPTITREELARRRETYARWWEALDQLAWRLSTRALGFVVRPPSAPRTPWLEPAAEGEAA